MNIRSTTTTTTTTTTTVLLLFPYQWSSQTELVHSLLCSSDQSSRLNVWPVATKEWRHVPEERIYEKNSEDVGSCFRISTKLFHSDVG